MGDGGIGSLPLAVGARLEDHLESDPEEQQPAGDLEGRQADAEKGEKPLSPDSEEGEDRKGDQGRLQGDSAPLGASHPVGQGNEDRR